MARFERGGKVFEITSEDAEYLNRQREHLRDGWRRVTDPRCETSLDGEPREPVLEAALRNDPGDLGAALVYADWLQQRGHPRGALIAVQHALVHRPDDAGLRAEEVRVIVDAGEALVSRPLLARVGFRSAHHEHELLELSPRTMPDSGMLTWDHGFLRAASVLLRRHAADEDLFWEILRHPSARFVSNLLLGISTTRDIGLVLALLLAAQPPLRKLVMRRDEYDRSASPRPWSAVSLAGLAATFPMLEELDLELAARAVQLHALPAERLRRLRLVIDGNVADLATVLATPWPALEELELARPNPSGLAATFAEPRFPVLRRLKLTHPTRGIELCRAVLRSPVAAGLERLDLTQTRLDPEAVTALVDGRNQLGRLDVLRVTRESVRENGVDRLRAAGYPIEADLEAD